MSTPTSIQNIYKLDGHVPVSKAIPFGLQHVLAMFISNIAPIMLIAQVATYNGAPLETVAISKLIQNAMFIAGIATAIQLYPVLKIGARLPIVMGVSFTFVSTLMIIAQQDFGLMIGAIIVGGVLEGLLGISVRHWKRFISPIVSACIVTTIGFSLLGVGISSFAQSAVYETGSLKNLFVGGVTLASCLLFQAYAKQFWKPLSVLFGLFVGYIVSIFFGMVDFNQIRASIDEMGIVSLPMMFAYAPKFNLSSIISVTLLFLISAAETIGDTTAICQGGLSRDVTTKELSGSLRCDGFISAIGGGIFASAPITSFSQNVGLVAMTKVVNRFTIFCGASILLLAGLFPPLGAFFSTLPNCVLGGCTLIMFGSIILSGVNMLAACGLDHRNMLIAATSFSVGIGVTQVPDFFSHMPPVIGDIFAGNPVAGVFVVSMILSLILPKSMEIGPTTQKSDPNL